MRDICCLSEEMIALLSYGRSQVASLNNKKSRSKKESKNRKNRLMERREKMQKRLMIFLKQNLRNLNLRNQKHSQLISRCRKMKEINLWRLNLGLAL